MSSLNFKWFNFNCNVNVLIKEIFFFLYISDIFYFWVYVCKDVMVLNYEVNENYLN